jgi:hypothetical protein
MEKTLPIIKEDMFNAILDRILQERVSVELYGTSKEDAFLSGINEGIDRAINAMKELEL